MQFQTILSKKDLEAGSLDCLASDLTTQLLNLEQWFPTFFAQRYLSSDLRYHFITVVNSAFQKTNLFIIVIISLQRGWTVGVGISQAGTILSLLFSTFLLTPHLFPHTSHSTLQRISMHPRISQYPAWESLAWSIEELSSPPCIHFWWLTLRYTSIQPPTSLAST